MQPIQNLVANLPQTPTYNEVTVTRLGVYTAVAALLLGRGGIQTSTTRLVLAVATDPRNRALVDVGPDDFLVSEAGAAREVLSVRVADYPIVVALDTRPGSGTDFPAVQQAARHFIERLGADRPITVATLGRGPKTVAAFDDSRSTLFIRLGALTPDAGEEPSDLVAGIAASARALRATESLFSAVVVLSAAPGQTPDGSASLADLVGSGAIVHAIVNQSGSSTGVPELRRLAAQTHGELTPIYSAASFQAALDRLVDRLSSELLVEYISPAGSDARDVKVGIRIPGARVRGLGVAPR